jgi:hypothetical protein
MPPLYLFLSKKINNGKDLENCGTLCVCVSLSLSHSAESEAPWAAKIAPPFNSNKRRHHRRRRRRLKQKVGVALKCVYIVRGEKPNMVAGWLEGIDAYRRASE